MSEYPEMRRITHLHGSAHFTIPLKVVVLLFIEYLKEKHPLKLKGDKIGLKLLTETNGVKSRFLMLEFVAIIFCQVSVIPS